MFKGVIEIFKNEVVKFVENLNFLFRGFKLSFSRSMVRQDFFDDFNDIFIGFLSDLELVGNLVFVGNIIE